MATVNLRVGSQLFGSVPVATLLAGGPETMLAVAVSCYLQEPDSVRAQELLLTLPAEDGENGGNIFKYVLCYLEDPEGFILPHKAGLAEAVLRQLAYFGLVDEPKAHILQGLSVPRILKTLAATCHTTRVAMNVLNHTPVMHCQEWHAAVVNDRKKYAKESRDFTAAQNAVWPWHTETCRKAELLFGERG